MWSYQALIVFLILLPGFITRTIIEALTPRKRQRDLSLVIESFIFSFITYAIVLYVYPDKFQWIFWQHPVLVSDTILSSVRPVIVLAFVVSVIMGLLWSTIINHDWLHWILRLIRVTTNTARSSTWLDTFSDMQGRSVIVTLGDNRRICGYPEYYSNDDGDPGVVFLANPEWIDDQGKYTSCKVRGILITKQEGLKRIEFMNHKLEIQELNGEQE